MSERNKNGKRTPLPIDWICSECADRAGGRCPGEGSTWHMDNCRVCKKYGAVTQPRDFRITFQEAMDYALRKNKALYQRLGKR